MSGGELENVWRVGLKALVALKMKAVFFNNNLLRLGF